MMTTKICLILFQSYFAMIELYVAQEGDALLDVNETLNVESVSHEGKTILSTVIKLRPIRSDSSKDNEVSTTWFQYPENCGNIIILCLGVTLSDQNVFPTTTIENFQSELKFIARTLSTKDKTIFVIISTVMGDYVIPLIDNHYCIEKIYLYDDTNDESSCQWSSISEKINGPYSDLKQLYDQITDDFNIMIKRPLRWNRSSDLFTMLYTQQLENQFSLVKVSTDVSYDEYIIIFHCNEQVLFHAEQESSPLNQFTNVNKCVEFINEHSQSQIFLVISGDMIPLEINLIFDSQPIHAIYLFRTKELNYSINKRKISGLFDKLEELANQLEKDILFFRHQHMHTNRINICTNFNREKELISQLNPEQMAFLTLQLYIDILPEIPSSSSMNNEVGNSLEQNFEFWQMISRLHQINEVKDLFVLQNQLVNIQKRLLEPLQILEPVTVYLAKIVSNETLKTIQSNSDGYFNISICLVATKSLLTARSIARQAANNGLISVLFEIEALKGTHWLSIDNDRVLFGLGSVFRLESINLAPDDVWYVKIKSTDAEFRLIKEQVQLEIGIPLSWLTYGNYLSVLNCFEQGEDYFSYLEKLPLESIDQSSIYNNMGLMYMINNREERAERYYKFALQRAESLSPDAVINEREDLSYMSIPTANMIIPKDLINHSTVLGNIGDVYHKKNNRTKALEFYRKAFESTTDQHCCQYYQQKILTLFKGLTIKKGT